METVSVKSVSPFQSKRARHDAPTMRVIIVGLLITAISTQLIAQQTDVIRGQVTGPDSLPVPGVEVRATSYQGGISKIANTDKNGRFTIVFINGEGDYWID